MFILSSYKDNTKTKLVCQMVYDSQKNLSKYTGIPLSSVKNILKGTHCKGTKYSHISIEKIEKLEVRVLHPPTPDEIDDLNNLDNEGANVHATIEAQIKKLPEPEFDENDETQVSQQKKAKSIWYVKIYKDHNRTQLVSQTIHEKRKDIGLIPQGSIQFVMKRALDKWKHVSIEKTNINKFFRPFRD